MWCFLDRLCRDLCLGKALFVMCSALTQSCYYSQPTDDTDNINKIIGSNSPETCFSYLVFFEKKGDPRLMDVYTRAFSNMPLAKHCQNESYARMLVRFAELKAWVWDYNNTLLQMPHSELITVLYLGMSELSFWVFVLVIPHRLQDVNDAEANFNLASSHCQDFAFVHIAHAQFERSQGTRPR